MTTIQHPFLDESDKSLMLALANQFPADNLHVTDLPYRLCSWAFDDPDNIGLWFDEKQHLVAWVVLQTPFWEIDLVSHPAFELSLYPEILTWPENRAIASIETPFGHPSW